MNTDLEQQLRDHYVSVADELDLPPMRFEELLDRYPAASTLPAEPGHSHRRSSRTWLMVAAIVALIAAGVVVLSARRTTSDLTDSERPTTVATPPRALSDVDELGPSDWVIATVLTDDMVWRYALTDDDYPYQSSLIGRQVTYGSGRFEGLGGRMGISIDSHGPPMTDAEPLNVEGTAWMLDADPNGWQAARAVGATTVSISDSSIFNDDDLAVLAGLVVVTESELPSPPLGRQDDAVDVARFDFDGVAHTLSVQESNGFWCTWVGSIDGLAIGCGGGIDRSAVITVEGRSNSFAEGASTSEKVFHGSVTPEVARVEVEFPDSTTVSVTPTDLSGQFDRKFWIAAAIVSKELVTPGEIRAYDEADQLLATEQLSQPG